MKGTRTTVFFDFDDTLLDTAKFKQLYWECLGKVLGISQEFVKSSYQKLRAEEKNGFSGPEVHLKDLGVSIQKIPGALIELRKLILNESSDLIFPEAKLLLESQEFRDSYDPRLITVGEPDFQRLKVESSGILRYFDHQPIYVEPNTRKADALGHVISKNEMFYLVDDKRHEGEAVTESFGHKAVVIIVPRVERDKFAPLIEDRLGITIEPPHEERLITV